MGAFGRVGDVCQHSRLPVSLDFSLSESNPCFPIEFSAAALPDKSGRRTLLQDCFRTLKGVYGHALIPGNVYCRVRGS